MAITVETTLGRRPSGAKAPVSIEAKNVMAITSGEQLRP
jgi:hypothetical protein